MRKLGNLKMRKVLLLALIGIALVSCRKSDDDSNGNSTADYELSADGRTLIKWKNAEYYGCLICKLMRSSEM